MFDLKDIRSVADQDPRHYLITDIGLKKAVDMAIWLQKPLLLTGAPGTGKTQLASKVAYELSLLNQEELKGFAPFAKTPFIFNTKTTCTASDLFYTYDAIGHFQKKYIDQDSKPNGNSSAHPYLQLNALGKAILQTHGKKAIRENLYYQELQMLGNFNDMDEMPQSSVVLIDEIDKAPRDFPNDLLNEIEYYEFNINEINKKIQKAKKSDSSARILVLMTSNFEKNLPDAFLRRCLFYHIASPGNEQLLDIVCNRMKPYLMEVYSKQNNNGVEDRFNEMKPKIRNVIIEFDKLRSQMVDKQPSTSELLEWIKVLEVEGFFTGEVDFTNLSEPQKTILKYTLPIIAKSKEDMERSVS
jgi:MoxR-like ATPase